MADSDKYSIFEGLEPPVTTPEKPEEDKDKYKIFEGLHQQFVSAEPVQNPSGYTPYAAVQQDVAWDTLHQNDSWVQGSQKFFEMTYGYVPQEGDAKLKGYEGKTYREKMADYGLKQMAGFNYNIGDMAIDTSRILEADQETKEAFIYLLDQYDEVDTSWHTASQAGWEMFTDVTNWVGVATLGLGTIVSQGAKAAGKAGVKHAVKESIKKGTKAELSKVSLKESAKRTGMLAGAEGMAHGVAADAMEQNVRIDAGQQDEYSMAQTAAMGGIGFAAGFGLGTGIDYGLSKLAKNRTDKRLMQATEEVRKEMIERGVKAGQDLADATVDADTAVRKALDNGVDNPADLNKAIEDDINAARAAEEPQAKPDVEQPKAEEPEVDPTVLPKNLQGAKPRYNYGDQPINLVFENDIAKALFIVGSKRKSKHFDQYMNFLEANGVTDIATKAKQMRDVVKGKAAKGETEVKLDFKTKKVKKAKIVERDGFKFREGDADPRPKVERVTAPFFNSSDELFELFSEDSLKALNKALNDFETNRYTPEEFSEVLSLINKMNEKQGQYIMKLESVLARTDLSDAQRGLITERLAKANDDYDAGAVLREHANAYSGRNLQDIQNFMLYRKQQGEEITQEMIDDATEKFYKRALKEVDDEYEVRINEEYKKVTESGSDDYSEVFKIIREREADTDRIDAIHELDKLGAKGYWTKESAGFQERFVEMSIAGVFSPSTIAYNTVFPFLKNYTYPMLDNLLNNPLKLQQWRRTIRVYGYMFGQTRAAMKAARTAAYLEQTTLTMDANRMLEGGVKNNFWGASFLRAFPRLLGASDAFNQEVAAAGHLMGASFDKLLTEGVEKGLKGKALMDYVDANARKEINKAYDFNLTEAKMRPIYEKGARMGLAGEALEKYVKKQLAKIGPDGLKTLSNPQRVLEMRARADELAAKGDTAGAKALREEADELDEIGTSAIDAVETLLYKKDFRKDQAGAVGAIERGIAKYDDLVKAKPLVKIFGNLFFRTPVWLFHESIKLTPGVNSMLLPTFRDDLGGVNGVQRQLRARTEASIAYSLMMYVTMKWAMGEADGSPNYDYTKRAELSKSKGRPLTIEDPFGLDFEEEVSFARWEPLRIPMTVTLNALEGYKDYFEKQNMDGFDPDKGIPPAMMQALTIGYATMISAIRDSGLTQGITDTFGTAIKATGFLEDDSGDNQEKAFDLITKLLADKASMVIPSIISKSQKALNDDVEITQSVRVRDKFIAKIAPNAPQLVRRYDVLGNVMELSAPLTQLTGFGSSTTEGMKGGRSDEEMEVLDYIALLEDLGFGNFSVQKFRDSRYPNQDLRKLYTEYNGVQMSVFDAMMREMQSTFGDALVAEILPLARAGGDELPFGAPFNRDAYGSRVTDTKEILSDYRSKALEIVISRDPALLKKETDIATRNKLLSIGVPLREQQELF